MFPCLPPVPETTAGGRAVLIITAATKITPAAAAQAAAAGPVARLAGLGGAAAEAADAVRLAAAEEGIVHPVAGRGAEHAADQAGHEPPAAPAAIATTAAVARPVAGAAAA